MNGIIKKNDMIDQIVTHIANGGTLVSYCRDVGADYSHISTWISQDPARSKQYLAAINMRAEWAVERTLHEVASLAFVDIRDAYRPDGSMKLPHEMPEHVARAIEAIEVDELFEGTGRERQQIGWTKRIKLANKLKAIELFGKQHGMFRDKVEVTGKLTLEDLVAKSKEDK